MRWLHVNDNERPAAASWQIPKPIRQDRSAILTMRLIAMPDQGVNPFYTWFARSLSLVASMFAFWRRDASPQVICRLTSIMVICSLSDLSCWNMGIATGFRSATLLMFSLKQIFVSSEYEAISLLSNGVGLPSSESCSIVNSAVFTSGRWGSSASYRGFFRISLTQATLWSLAACHSATFILRAASASGVTSVHPEALIQSLKSACART